MATSTGWFNVKDTAFAGGAKGDGVTDDYAAIRACINAALAASTSTAGQTVYFPAGTYILGSEHEKASNVGIYLTAGAGRPLRFLGDGSRASIIKWKPGLYPLAAKYLFQVDQSLFTLESMGFDGNKANIIPLYDPVTNPDSLLDQQMHLFEFENCSTIALINCAFDRAPRDAMRFIGSVGTPAAKIQVLGCTFSGNGRSGITAQRGLSQIIVNGCYFEQTQDQCFDGESTGSLPDNPDFIITNNIFKGNGNSQTVTFQGPGDGARCSFIFAGNRVDGGGVSCSVTKDSICSGNTIDSSAVPGAQGLEFIRSASNITVIGNRVKTQLQGIRFQGTSGSDTRRIERIIVADNHVEVTSDNGIDVDGAQYATISGNTVVSTTKAGIANGIKLQASISGASITQDSERCVIANNVVDGFLNAIAVQCSGTRNVKDVTVQGNTCLDSGAGGRVGLFLSKGTGVLSKFCIANNLFGTGITTQISGLANVTGQQVGGWGINNTAYA